MNYQLEISKYLQYRTIARAVISYRSPSTYLLVPPTIQDYCQGGGHQLQVSKYISVGSSYNTGLLLGWSSATGLRVHICWFLLQYRTIARVVVISYRSQSTYLLVPPTIQDHC